MDSGIFDDISAILESLLMEMAPVFSLIARTRAAQHRATPWTREQYGPFADTIGGW
jgi:hypothetical protein